MSTSANHLDIYQESSLKNRKEMSRGHDVGTFNGVRRVNWMSSCIAAAELRG